MSDSGLPDIVTLANGQRLDRRQFLALGLSAGAAAAVLACAPSGPAAGTASTGGATAPKRLADSVTIATQSLIDTLDPHGTLSNSGFQYARQVYDCLLTWQGDKLAPQLASEWKRIDATTVELKLRDDVKFANGEPFTADVAKFNVDRIVNSTDPLHVSTKQRLATLASAEAVNSTILRIKTKTPDALIFNRLTTLFMVSQKFAADGNDLKTKAMGTGSFKVNEFVVQNRIVLEAWDGTWRGKSTVSSARILAIPEEAAILAALKTGEVDIVNPVGGDKVAGLKADFNVTAVSAGSCTVDSILPVAEIFRDKRLREAINLAVNKEEIIKTIWGGYAKPAGQLLQPGFLGYRDDLKPFPFDPEKAKALIKQAGAEGTDVGIGIVVAIKAYNEAIVGFLNAVGLKARLQTYEFPAFVPQLVQKSENAMIAWRTDYFQLRDFDSAGGNFAARPPGFQKHMHNDEFDKLYAAAQAELDVDKRKTMIGRMAEIMHDEIPVLFLGWQEFPVVYTKKIEKLDVSYDTAVYLWKVEKSA